MPSAASVFRPLLPFEILAFASDVGKLLSIDIDQHVVEHLCEALHRYYRSVEALAEDDVAIVTALAAPMLDLQPLGYGTWLLVLLACQTCIESNGFVLRARSEELVEQFGLLADGLIEEDDLTAWLRGRIRRRLTVSRRRRAVKRGYWSK